jgi:translation elongation factor EF-G
MIQVEGTYTGPQTSDLAASMKACDPEGPVMVQIAKLYHTTDAQSFRAFGRVMSGTLRKGMDIKVLGEGYSPEDEEDMMQATVEDIWISEARYASVLVSLGIIGINNTTDISFQQKRSPLAISCLSGASTRQSPKQGH